MLPEWAASSSPTHLTVYCENSSAPEINRNRLSICHKTVKTPHLIFYIYREETTKMHPSRSGVISSTPVPSSLQRSLFQSVRPQASLFWRCTYALAYYNSSRGMDGDGFGCFVLFLGPCPGGRWTACLLLLLAPSSCPGGVCDVVEERRERRPPKFASRYYTTTNTQQHIYTYIWQLCPLVQQNTAAGCRNV